MTRKDRFAPLPRTPTVRDVLRAYNESKRGRKDEKVGEVVADALLLYFDQALPVALLYRQERGQYTAVAQAHKGSEVKPSDVYGAEHLLRLFSSSCRALRRPSGSPAHSCAQPSCRRCWRRRR